MSENIGQPSLEPGDVLVCYSPQMIEEVGCESGYSHAAIYLGAGEILESGTGGVKIISIEDLLSIYDHVAVLRASDTWSHASIQRLKQFGSLHVGKKFNIRALPKIEFRREESLENAQQHVEDYFSGRAVSVKTDRELYFCSELVVSAFIDSGIISDSAAVLFKPETFFPIDIAKDKVFGFFIGYIKKSDTYEVPSEDWFQSNI